MIRTVTDQDAPAVIAVAVASELFSVADAEIVARLMSDYFTGSRDEDGHRCLIDGDGDGHAVGVAYWQPAPAADRTWYLTMIAVRLEHQRAGRGAALLRHVEDDLRAQGQRLLLVETSGLASFERARAFYLRCGYQQEARVRDFYAPGDDLILFRKDLTHNPPRDQRVGAKGVRGAPPGGGSAAGRLSRRT